MKLEFENLITLIDAVSKSELTGFEYEANGVKLNLTKEKERLTKEISRCEGMLGNPNFVNKAPQAKVNAEKEKLQKYMI